MQKESYPQGYRISPKEPFNLKKWNDTLLKVQIAAREYNEYTDDEIVNYLTSKWDFQEQESFKKWLKQTKRGQQNMNMQKIAYDYNAANKEQQLNEFKKKLRSRINSAERLLNKMFDEGLLAGNDDKALYIGRILQKLKEEVNLLKRPQLIAARHKRASGIFCKAGLVELADIMSGSVALVEAFEETSLVKTAKSSKGAPKQETLKKNKVPLTDEEREKVMKAGAVWHFGGEEAEATPAIWKAVVDGKAWYACNTHRAIQIKDSLEGAIRAFDFISTTASLDKTAQIGEEGAASLVSAMEGIKEELDVFNYGVHLDKLMQIRSQLLLLHGDAEASMILDIIKKELDDVDGIHKKLVEIYTSLGQIPRKAKPKAVESEMPKLKPQHTTTPTARI